MPEKREDREELYTGWFGVWVLLCCMEREFFCGYDGEEIPTAEKLEQMRQRAEEMRELLIWCKEGGFLRLEDVDAGGSYKAIIRGLSAVAEQIGSGGGGTVEEWREIESQIIRVKIHAWAQRARLLAWMLEAARADVVT